MMDKSIRKCKDIEILNAHELDRTRTQKHGERGEYLTDFAYKFTENEWLLSKSNRAMKINNNEYCVYFPDDMKPKRGIIPAFYRLRRVKCINNKYFTCSCGLPSRMKLPCRHIMTIIGRYSIEMFALRWLIFYQHAFETKGFEKLTELFQEMEVAEFERNYDLGETIFVKDYFCSLGLVDYPIKVGIMSDKDIENMNMMIEAEKEQKILVRGYTIEEQL